jgi:hypothetical protein
MLTKRVRRLLGVAAVAPLLLTSCDNSPFDPFDDVLGTYQLTVFAGASVPANFACSPGECGMVNGGSLRVNGGTLVLRSDGTFTERNDFTETPNGESSRSYSLEWDGTYNINGDQFTLSAPAQNGLESRFATGTVEFDSIRYVEDNFSYEYRR